MPTRPSSSFILSRRHLPVLAQFAAANVLLAFDYDGTLAPIASTPGRARMRATTRRLLTRLAKCYPCVVISGRPLADLTRRLRQVPVWHLVGDHGYESRGETPKPTGHVREWVGRLRELLPANKGLLIERKRNSITVHYRHARDKRRLVTVITDAVRQLPGARAINGAEAINIIPAQGPNKGIALQQACRVFACDAALYVGDDDTDEDAFASAGPERLLSIRVGTRRPSMARYRLRRQEDLDLLLRALLELRSPPRRSRRAVPSRATESLRRGDHGS